MLKQKKIDVPLIGNLVRSFSFILSNFRLFTIIYFYNKIFYGSTTLVFNLKSKIIELQYN